MILMVHPVTQNGAESISAERARRRNLLNILLLCLLIAALFTRFALHFAPVNSSLTHADIDRMSSAITVVVIAIVITYAIARWISLDLGSAIFVGALIVASAVSDTPEEVINGRSLVAFAIPVLIAGLILPAWASLVTAGIVSIAIFWIGVVNGDELPAIPSMLILFFMALVAWLFARSMNTSNAKLQQTLQELRRREADFRVLFADNPLPMCVARTSDARLIEVNEAAVLHYGYSRGELLNLNVTDILVELVGPPIERSTFPAEWPFYSEQRHRTKPGTVIDVYVSAHRISVFGDDAILVVAQDITERKRAEKQLDLMARVVHESPISTVITNLDGVIEFVNHTFEDLTGFASTEVIGQTWQVLRPENSVPGMGEEIHRALAEGKVWHTEFDALLKSSAHVRMSLSVSALHDATGSVTNLLSTARDITARYQAEQALLQLTGELEQRVAARTAELEHANRELARSSRLKDEFLATMSHELRTPLTGILGGADALLEEVYGPLNPRQMRAVRLVHRSGDHLLAIINGILDLSKIEAGAMVLEPYPIRVTDVCTASLQLVAEQTTLMEHAISYSCTPQDLVIEADPKRLTQILVNLLDNANKFTAKGGRIHLAVYADSTEERVTFAVTDNGIGIAAEDLPRLFHPFIQLDSGLNRSYEGTGLGLALVRRLAEMHGGGVGVESTLDHGSRFWVALPYRPAATCPPPDTSGAKIPDAGAQQSLQGALQHNPHILLAEDSPSSIQLVLDYLEPLGCEIMTVSNGLEAVRCAAANRPDLILMDIQMPYLDGIAAIKQIRACNDPVVAAIPIVAVTALAMHGDQERCLAAGANAYLSKPFTVRSLRSTVTELLLSATPAQ